MQPGRCRDASYLCLTSSRDTEKALGKLSLRLPAKMRKHGDALPSGRLRPKPHRHTLPSDTTDPPPLGVINTKNKLGANEFPAPNSQASLHSDVSQLKSANLAGTVAYLRLLAVLST